jgi:uncharacterized repeat protein (TIGR01451 family)
MILHTAGSHAASADEPHSNTPRALAQPVPVGVASSTTVAGGSEQNRDAHLNEAYGKLPLSFEANEGQTDQHVKFLSRGSGYRLFLTANEAVLALSAPVATEIKERPFAGAQKAVSRLSTEAGTQSAVLRMKLLGANPHPQVTGAEPQSGRTNYFIGRDSKQWRTQIESYAQVRYKEIYPGIDLTYYGNQRQLEYDFVVAPGGNPDAINLTFSGADKILIDADGALVLRTAAGDIRQHKPVLYQESNGQRLEIKGRYVIKRERKVGFEIEEYDRSKPLIIDPVLVYSTYLGGNAEDRSYSIAVDSSGSTYIAGRTSSTNFPTPGSIQPAKAGYDDAFVVKLNPAGTAIIYATYLGGTRGQWARSIAVDADGNAYVLGSTNSPDFPTKNALRDSLRGGTDLFVTKLNADGSAITYSTFLGGSNNDGASGIAVDAGGNTYLTGNTFSTDFPLANALQDAKSGDAIFTSADSGSTWSPGSKGLGGAQVSAFAFNPVTPSTVYAATDTGVFKSADSGSNWSATGQIALPSSTFVSTTQNPISDIVIDPINPSTLYVSSCDGIYKTIDGGDHWSASNSGLGNDYTQVSHLAIDRSNPLTIYTGTYFGSHAIYKSIDGGASWSPSDANLNLDYPNLFDLVIDPTNPSILYAALNGNFYKSTDGAKTWNSFPYLNFDGGTVYDIAIDPTNTSTLYIGTDVGIWKSVNGGVSMTRLAGSPWYVPFVIVDPTNPSIIYASTGDLTIARSTDGGNTWTTASTGFAREFVQIYNIVLAFDPANTTRLYAGGYSGADAFLTKLNPAGTQLIYSTYIGGTSNETSMGVALDAAGNAYIAGATDSTDIHVVNAVQTTNKGGKDAYVAKVNATGSDFAYFTYLGGQYDEEANDVAVDAAGNAYVTGYTNSANFPTINSLRQPTYENYLPNYILADAFVTKLNPLGSALVYSTFLGGNFEDYGRGIAVDSAGNAYVVGDTKSTDLLVFGAPQTIKDQREDVFVSAIDAAGSTLLYSTYLGGNQSDISADIAVGPDASAYITGRSFSTNFPTVNPIQASRNAGNDAFIAKLSPDTSNGARADLSITQTDSPDPAAEGQLITYTLTITNNGPSPATGIVVNDPAQFFDVSYTSGTTSTGGQCSLDGFGHTITCSVGNLAVGAQATVTIKLTHNWYGSPTTIRNTVVVGSNEPDPNLSNNTVTEETTIAKALAISGFVRNSAGVALKGITLMLSGTRSATNTTNDQGSYYFSSLPQGGSYTVTPSLANYVFNPPEKTLNNLSADQALDFTAIPLTLSINGASITEGDAGHKDAILTVNLSAPSSQTVTVGYGTTALSATSGVDYQPVSGTLTFAPGVTTQTINVPIIGDVLDELDESFSIFLTNPTNAVLSSSSSAQGTIVDDDPSPSLSITNTSLNEGHAGTTNANFNVSLSQSSSQVVTVDYATADGAASAGSDYMAAPGKLTFNPGETTKTISIIINGDVTVEPDETFTVTLSNPTNAVLGTSVGTGTIINDDAAGTLQFSNTSYSADEGAGIATITVLRTLGSSGAVTVNYAASNGTATAGQDFTANSGTLTFASGETSKSFTMTVNDDHIFEGDETFNLTLSNVTGGAVLGTPATAVVVITENDKPHPVLEFNQSSYSIIEGTGSLYLLVNRSGDPAMPVTLNYSTTDAANFLQNCNVLNGAATSRCDYVGVLGTLHFAAGETSKTLSIPIVDDTYLEGAESFFISLSNPTGGAVLGANQRATIQITDNSNDVSGIANPIDDQNFFVRQHYIDFLSREPDPLSAGWVTILNQCGAGDQSCRLSVSQGIYNSPEFRDRGYFIYKFYSVALGRKPSYDEFNVDRARVSGFQTEAELEQSKVDFIADFMSRTEFTNIYNGLTDNAYVQRLYDTAGVTQVTAGATVLNVAQMQGAMTTGKTRGQVLREVAESPEVSSRFQTESTVVMHYFGYLRRDPDASYQDWINILTSTGDSRNVTSGFINSPEYRARFGQ